MIYVFAKKVSALVISLALAGGVATPAFANSAPTQVAVRDKTAQNAGTDEGLAEVSWNVPAIGSPVGYSVTAKPRELGYTSKTGGTAVCNNTSCTSLVGDLPGGVSFDFEVTAFFAGGAQQQGSLNGFKVVTAPSQPTQLTAVAQGQTSIVLSWTPSPNNGGSAVTEFRIKNSADGTLVATASGEVSTHTVAGLQSGQSYTFTLEAINLRGSSGTVPFPATNTGSTTPGEPDAPALVQSGNEIQVSWTAPDQGASAITSYRVFFQDSIGNELRAPITPSPATLSSTVIPNVIPGVYRVQVQAINSAGPGPRSLHSTITVTAIASGGGAGASGAISSPPSIGGGGSTLPIPQAKPRSAFIDVIQKSNAGRAITVSRSWRTIESKRGSLVRMQVRSLRPGVVVTTWVKTPNGQTFKIASSKIGSNGLYRSEAIRFKTSGTFKISVVYGSTKRSLVVSVAP